MPSTAYNSLVNLVARFIEPVKAADIVSRQVAGKHLTMDALTTADLATVHISIKTAAGLYIPDAEAKAKMIEALKTLCAT